MKQLKIFQNKKAATNMFQVFMILIVITGCFVGLYTFYNQEAVDSGYAISAHTAATNTILTNQMNDMSEKTDNIRDEATKLQETGVGGMLVGTVRGFTSVILLFKDVIGIGFTSVNALTGEAESAGFGIPTWVIVIIMVLIVLYIVFAILRAISGRLEI